MISAMPSIVFFHAPNDAAAGPNTSRPTLPDNGELSVVLRELECFLNDRSYDDVNCDERHLAIVSELGIYIDYYVATLTDTLRDALASADEETLEAALRHWPIAGELAPVARGAASAGERLYVRWSAYALGSVGSGLPRGPNSMINLGQGVRSRSGQGPFAE
ncbi:hypothetical protein SAMN06264365_14122 [Actinoplanes regularis]|uniref:Uncharacterized protein n=2 Tax=Actinoplanes regularis TaxID=52697 RepID=A0A239K3V4_9ACTN|nr:hypothetical protein SAMN06264365_14122 [Actinoplanes regularis]